MNFVETKSHLGVYFQCSRYFREMANVTRCRYESWYSIEFEILHIESLLVELEKILEIQGGAFT